MADENILDVTCEYNREHENMVTCWNTNNKKPLKIGSGKFKFADFRGNNQAVIGNGFGDITMHNAYCISSENMGSETLECFDNKEDADYHLSLIDAFGTRTKKYY